MRWSGLAGFCSLLVAANALVGCDDDEDRINNNTAGTSSGGSSSGSGGKATGGSKGGSDSEAGTAGSFVNGGSSGTGGTDAAGADTGGTAGTAGTGGTPACTTDGQCADTNPCTDDTCTDGECVHENNTAECDDGNDCTSDDACDGGSCEGTNNTIACDDLSSCTTDDKCGNGACGGTKDLVKCPACDDANNLIQNCDFTDGTTHWADNIVFGGGASQMVVDVTAGGVNIFDVQPRQEPLSLKSGMKYKLRMVAGASVDRDIVVALTQAGTPYKVHSEGDNAGGGFTLQLKKQMDVFEFEFTMLDPDDANTKLEIKLGGAIGNPSVVYFDDVYVVEEKCDANPFCDDDNECTDDVCTIATGICSWTPTTAACTSDENSCTTDVCAAGECTHAALDDDAECDDDADNCTDDVCKAGECKNIFNTDICDCALDEHCDDDNVCTTDTCNAGTCENVANALTCDDGEVCTSNDVCDAGLCGGVDNTDACVDDDVCTINNMCAAGECGPGTNICFDCTTGGNLLANCDLAVADGTGWLPGFFDGGAGTQSVQNGLLAITITGAGAAGYTVQPRQEGIVLVKDQPYLVKFNAMASIPRDIVVSITKNGPNYDSYSTLQTLHLTTELSLQTFEFTMTADPPAEKVKFEIDLGGPNNTTLPNTVYFDNVFFGPKP